MKVFAIIRVRGIPLLGGGSGAVPRSIAGGMRLIWFGLEVGEGVIGRRNLIV